jgi:3,5-dihydroxyphenylacetyl-CoA synthase
MTPTYLIAQATTAPDRLLSQPDFLARFRRLSPTAKRIGPHLGVRQRRLALEEDLNGEFIYEDETALLAKHRILALDLGSKVTQDALTIGKIPTNEVGFICCVTSTGLLVPGLSSLLMEQLQLPTNCHRADLVGMGCNGGLSGLRLLYDWTRGEAGRVGALVCCEINSAAYDIDETVDVGIINGLFGDGAAAAVLQSSDDRQSYPRIVDFESYTNYDRLDAMRFEWNDKTKRRSFRTTRDVALVVGDAVRIPVEALLSRYQLTLSEVQHWVVHTGGASVINAVKKALCLSDYQLRHTISVLSDYGNVSSGSVLFSLERLMNEASINAGEPVVMIAMGPGATIEVALLNL